MALVFSDDQIKSLTALVLEAPISIASLTTDKANVVAQKAKYLADDNGNAVYTNNWKGIIDAYHDEGKYLDGLTKTPYSLAAIDPAARLIDGNIHFITSPIWVNFQPKVHASNTGLPTFSFPTTEQAAINQILTSIALLKTGWTDGAATTTTTAAFVVDEVDVTSAAGFLIGNRVLFISGSNYLYGTIATITGLKLKIVIISASAGFTGIAMGATVTNFFAGFNLTQRESGAGTNAGLTAFMAALKLLIDGDVATWQGRLTPQQTALNANDAIGVEATEITTAKNNVASALLVITTWQSFPSIGVGTSRFGTNLPPLESKLGTRPAEITTRAGQIPTRLGSISQAADGSFTGTGNYFKLFENLNARLNKAGGTRRQFYSADLGVILFDQLIANATSQAARDSITFTIAKLTAPATGTNQVTVDTVVGLAVSNTVKVIGTTLPTITTTITSIAGLVLTLGALIPNTYTLGEISRVVKQN